MANYTINDEISEMRRYFSEQLPNWEKATAEMLLTALTNCDQAPVARFPYRRTSYLKIVFTITVTVITFAKVRISEHNTKQKTFFCFYCRTRVLSTESKYKNYSYQQAK